jgi:hypothetical protein
VAVASTDRLERSALELAGSDDQDAAVTALLEAAGGDRTALELARNQVARRLHSHVGDWRAGAALGLLNKALVKVGWTDPYDWKIRWSQPFRRP